MEKTKMLNQIRTLLNIEVKLEEMKLENGTVVSAETFEKGSEIFIVTDDEKVAMPVGEYILEDGRLVIVEAEGMIADVRDVSDDVPAKEETTEDLETVETEVPEEVATEVEAIIEAVVEVIAPVIEEVKSEIEELKKEFGKMRKYEDEKEEEEEDKKKEEMSAARKPIKHNPEAKTAQRKQMQFAKGQFNTTLDRVLNKLNK
jgi:Mg2+ and Co2+ transporter CorA